MSTMIKINLLALLVIIVISGCGGGGGEYFPPSISLNTKKIVKEPFNDTSLGKNNRIAIDRDRGSDHSNDRIIEGHTYYYFRKILFKNKEFTLAIPIDNWISILNSEGKIVTKLKTPRYTRDAVAIELTHTRFEPVLAILIDQQSTSHSSTLYVIDSSFTPIYKEHLLGANWISKIHSSSGDQLLVSTEDKWMPRREWITIGGNWQYRIFNEIKESHNQANSADTKSSAAD